MYLDQRGRVEERNKIKEEEGREGICSYAENCL
jgi:hypothetical protein